MSLAAHLLLRQWDATGGLSMSTSPTAHYLHKRRLLLATTSTTEQSQRFLLMSLTRDAARHFPEEIRRSVRQLQSLDSSIDLERLHDNLLTSKRDREAFCDLDGIPAFMRYIVRKRDANELPEERLRPALMALREALLDVENSAAWNGYGSCTWFLDALFEVLPTDDDYLREVAVQIFEALLLRRPEAYQLQNIRCLPKLADGLPSNEAIFHFARMLSAIFFGNNPSRPIEVRMKTSTEWANDRVHTINHCIVMAMPNILKRLLVLMDQVAETLNNAPDDSYEDVCFQLITILHVFLTLLGGCRKHHMQMFLLREGIVNSLLNLFPRLNWTDSSRKATPEHDSDSENDESDYADDSLRAHYLRVVYSLCDLNMPRLYDRQLKVLVSKIPAAPFNFIFDDSLPLFLSLDGKMEVKLSPFGRIWLDPQYGQLMPRLSKMLEVPPSENSLVWLSGSVDVFLKACTTEDQLAFVQCHGLFPHMKKVCMSDDTTFLQYIFDLLSECIRYNLPLFQQFDALFTPGESEKLADVMIANIVDANVFLRAVLLTSSFVNVASRDKVPVPLSQEDFAKQQEIKKSLKLPQCIEKREMEVLLALLKAISPGSLTQNNVSCLNTLLLWMILLDRQDRLQEVIEKISTLSPPDATDTKAVSKKSPLRNLYELSFFWYVYYVYHGKDSQAMADTSSIPIRQWRAMSSKVFHLSREMLLSRPNLKSN